MIEYIKGELTDLTPALAVIEAAGIGYALNISLNTFSAIQGKKEVKLYVYEAIREDALLSTPLRDSGFVGYDLFLPQQAGTGEAVPSEDDPCYASLLPGSHVPGGGERQ